MKRRLTDLVAALRREGVAVSVAESIDAAAAAAVIGVERTALKDGLAAALVKDEHDRPIYDEIFDRVFPATVRSAARPRRRAARGRPGTGGAGGRGIGSTAPAGAAGSIPERQASAGPPDQRDVTDSRGGEATDAGDMADMAETPWARETVASEGSPNEADPVSESEQGGTRATNEKRPRKRAAGEEHADERAAANEEREDERARKRTESERRAQSARERHLLALPFRAMSPRDVEEAEDLVRELARRFAARLRRRLRPRTSGRLDFRRTIRAAVPRGGVPLERHYRGRRPGKLTLVALCDLSASTATATDFFLALLAPASSYFTSVRLFGYVDRLVEIEFAEGQIRPAGPIDLMARSDFGRVLVDLLHDHGAALTANTVVLVLGDARNNRRPPRADLLAAARARVRRLVWLNPDPAERWNTGDSVIDVYARHADLVLRCASLTELDHALRRLGG